MRFNLFNKTQTQNFNNDLAITKPELERILEHSINPTLRSGGLDVVPWNKESLLNIVNSNLAREKFNQNHDKLNTIYTGYLEKMKDFEAFRLKGDRLLEIASKNYKVNDIIHEKKDLNNSNISDIKEYIHTSKETILSDVKLTTTPLTQSKSLGVAGDITINELINKGIEVIDTSLVQMIKDNVNINVVGFGISTMIMYKAVMKLYMKSAYGPGSLPVAQLSGPSTRPREIAYFMVMGAPAIVGGLMIINMVTAGGTKVILNVAGNTELEGSSSGSSNSSFFLFLNKLPS